MDTSKCMANQCRVPLVYICSLIPKCSLMLWIPDVVYCRGCSDMRGYAVLSLRCFSFRLRWILMFMPGRSAESSRRDVVPDLRYERVVRDMR